MDACFADNLKEEIELTKKEVGHEKVSVSYDMGWQRKGTGHTYDSNSGHAYYIGVRCGKVLRYHVYSKKCHRCKILMDLGEDGVDHDDCPCNYLTGSSKAMEASAALELLLQLYALGVEIEFIVSDDDSTMRAHLKHISAHQKGKLSIHIPEPVFLCDPSHRIKVMVKDIFGLALASNSKSECQKIDALRLKKYLGCWIGKSKLLPFAEFKRLSKAPVEHLFATHEWCSAEWCFSAELDQATEKYSQKATAAVPAPHPLLPLTAPVSQFRLPPRL